jgi:Aerobic-type carbon monoxide dehydrogenase, middle subunit CoxM/CutM homologs
MIREYYQPDTLIKALQLRKDLEGSALLAGGTDLVVSLHNDRGPEGSIIDLSKIRELKGIELTGDNIRIGPMTTFTEISDSELLKGASPMLCQAAELVGSPQIRNRGTIGGNICNASAAGDGMTPLLCLDAEVELRSLSEDGSDGIRVISLEDFLIDSKKTARKDNEILTGILFKCPSSDTLTAFQKIGRRNALAIARLNGSCALCLKDNKIESIRFALGAATSKPERIKAVEELLTGIELTDELLKNAGKSASEYVLEKTGMRSSSSYKLPVIEKFTVSLIHKAFGKEEQTHE